MAETVSTATQGEIPLTEDMYTKKGVDELLANAVKGGVTPKGSCAFADLPTPGPTNVGWMYDVSDAFTTTSAFVEGQGKNYPAHTNIYVVTPSTNTYKWDVLPGEGPQPYTSNPAANGTASAGSSANYARGDHVHPTDQTRQAKITASGILKGDGSGGVAAATAGTDYVVPSALSGYVPTSRTVNSKPLSSDIVLSAEDIGDGSGGTVAGALSNISSMASGAATTAGTAVQSVKISGSSTELKSGTTATIPLASTTEKGVVQLSDSTSSNASTTAATSKAVKAAKDAADSAASAASGVGTRVSAIETAAGTLYTALSGLDATSMTSANAIKTLVSSLLSYLKAFAAASDNDNSTSYSAS